MSEKCEYHSGLLADVTTLKKSDELQWEAINNIRNRPPVWATLLLTAMGGVVGWALTYATLAQKAMS